PNGSSAASTLVLRNLGLGSAGVLAVKVPRPNTSRESGSPIMQRTVLLFGLLAMCSVPLLAADRLTDRDVKALVDRIEKGRDKFDDALDDKLKHSIVRGPNGEVNVDAFLNDFQKNIDRLEERLKPDYAASAEAGTLLRQATVIDAFFRQQPSGTRGESEWNRLATDMKALAKAYGAQFPLADKA